MYKVIKKTNNGWEVHKALGSDTISLVKYNANHHDIKKLLEVLRLLYRNKVIEGSINMNMAMHDEYLQDLSVEEYKFIINLDFWETFIFYPKQKEGNLYVMKVFDKLAVDSY